MKNYLLQLVVASATVATFMSCSKDLAGSSYEDVQKQKYAADFVAKYGQIDANQSWDFSTGERQLATRGVTKIKTQVLKRVSVGEMCRKSRRPQGTPVGMNL